MNRNVFIVGAQKSATTTLHHLLSLHPKIDGGIKKEPDFFSLNRNYQKGIEWYQSNFKMDNKIIKLDSSQSYFSLDFVPKRIKQTFSDAKIIVILRDPIERIESAFNHFKNKVDGEMRKDINEIVKSFRKINDLKQITQIEKDTIKILIKEKKIIPREKEWAEYNGFPFNYIYNSIYSWHLKNYLEYFNKSDILLVKFDDFVKNQKQEYFRICKFLGIEPIDIFINDTFYKNKTFYFKNKQIVYLINKVGPFYNKYKNFIPLSLIKMLKKILYKKEKDRLNEENKIFLKKILAKEIEKSEKLLL